jgi:pyruvate/2-oxoacid:ferredoxin oxidoreductase beta subunit
MGHGCAITVPLHPLSWATSEPVALKSTTSSTAVTGSAAPGPTTGIAVGTGVGTGVAVALGAGVAVGVGVVTAVLPQATAPRRSTAPTPHTRRRRARQDVWVVGGVGSFMAEM